MAIQEKPSKSEILNRQKSMESTILPPIVPVKNREQQKMGQTVSALTEVEHSMTAMREPEEGGAVNGSKDMLID